MKRSKSTMTRRVDDEAVILDVESGRYFGLNEVGAFVWDLLEHEVTHDDLVDAVAGSFDVDRERASGDVAALCGELIERGLLEP